MQVVKAVVLTIALTVWAVGTIALSTGDVAICRWFSHLNVATLGSLYESM
ncbi:hypothetical protein [Alkalinema sp. FACHB-956]|nr:hypothetical protein [Alkalinema sp. FACHB-956]MBD2328652.1 hypothetical protein [Alkalinema sp. FACHB-956]